MKHTKLPLLVSLLTCTLAVAATAKDTGSCTNDKDPIPLGMALYMDQLVPATDTTVVQYMFGATALSSGGILAPTTVIRKEPILLPGRVEIETKTWIDEKGQLHVEKIYAATAPTWNPDAVFGPPAN